MKIIITSICLSFMLLFSAISAKALTFYVVSGEQFQLSPLVPNLTTYNWTLNGTNAISGEINSTTGVYTKTLTLADSLVSETKTITLSVLDPLKSCLSEVATHTVIILPKTISTLSSATTSFCSGQAVSALLAFTVDAITGLPSGVSVVTTWTKDAVAYTLPADKIVTAAGVYVAKTEYALPVGFLANATQLAKTVSSKTIEIIGNVALPAAPVLSIL